MFLTSSRFLLTVTLALSLASTGFAHQGEHRHHDHDHGHADVSHDARSPPSSVPEPQWDHDIGDLLSRFEAIKHTLDDPIVPRSGAEYERRGIRSTRRAYQPERRRRRSANDLFLDHAIRESREAAADARRAEKDLVRTAKLIVKKYERRDAARSAVKEGLKKKARVLRALKDIVHETRQLAEKERRAAQGRTSHRVHWHSDPVEDEEDNHGEAEVHDHASEEDEEVPTSQIEKILAQARELVGKQESTTARKRHEDAHVTRREVEELLRRAKQVVGGEEPKARKEDEDLKTQKSLQDLIHKAKHMMADEESRQAQSQSTRRYSQEVPVAAVQEEASDDPEVGETVVFERSESEF